MRDTCKILQCSVLRGSGEPAQFEVLTDSAGSVQCEVLAVSDRLYYFCNKLRLIRNMNTIGYARTEIIDSRIFFR